MTAKRLSPLNESDELTDQQFTLIRTAAELFLKKANATGKSMASLGLSTLPLDSRTGLITAGITALLNRPDDVARTITVMTSDQRFALSYAIRLMHDELAKLMEKEGALTVDTGGTEEKMVMLKAIFIALGFQMELDAQFNKEEDDDPTI